jgi:hypothetical protein
VDSLRTGLLELRALWRVLHPIAGTAEKHPMSAPGGHSPYLSSHTLSSSAIVLDCVCIVCMHV